MSILKLIRPELLNSINYTPGGEDALHRLHANELPWSPLPSNSLQLNYYPDHKIIALLEETLADRYQVKKDQITLVRGSDDGIDVLTRLFLTARNDSFMQFPPTFPLYSFYVRLQEAELIQCPLDEENGFILTLERIKKTWKSNCKIIMFCSPNNPTANTINLELIAATCKYYTDKSIIIVDEAYMDFSESESALSLLSEFENLIVLRTMSKACGLASLRLGAIIAQAHIIRAVNSIIAPYTISSAIAYLAIQALENKDWFPTICALVKSSRKQLINQLQRCPIIEKVYPSETNFIFIKTAYAKELTQWLAKKGFAIRDFPEGSSLGNHLRITVGKESQNQLLCSLLDSFAQSINNT